MHGIKGLRFVLLVAAVFAYYGHGRDSSLFAAREAWCDDDAVCNSSVECGTECVNRDVNPQENITCGDFYGGWVDDYCEGHCTDPRTCDDYETHENCPWDCGEPGDGYCQYAYESYTTGDGDCGTCGDHICQRPAEATGANYCEADCGPRDLGGTECDPSDPDSCSDGKQCNANGQCVEVSMCNWTGVCQQESDCCTGNGEHCYFNFIDSAYGQCLPEIIYGR